MMLLENQSLKLYNTFHIEATARYFAAFKNMDELQELLSMPESNKQLLVLGGGSNMLFTKDFDGLVIKNELTGIRKVHEDEHYVYVESGAGENWHQFVQYCINNNWGGVENLSLIPGNTGASPMQNIGAYGVEIKDVFYSLEAYHIKEKKLHQFTLNDCAFGYRESVFKKKCKGEFVITKVVFRLSKDPVFNIAYGAITQELDAMGVKDLTVKAISQAVINIRQSKLPDPNDVGNAGSFFKNPTVSNDQYEQLRVAFTGIVGYPLPDGNVKLAAGWLIEQCGWKGYRKGDAGCHSKQALVLVNYGNAKGNDVFHLSEDILQSVKNKFNVTLEREVNIV